jgi:hypothetical protein
VEKKNAEIAESRAPRQIKEKRHADKYRALEKPICLIGVEFSRKKRNVAAFEVKAPDQGLGIRGRVECFRKRKVFHAVFSLIPALFAAKTL